MADPEKSRHYSSIKTNGKSTNVFGDVYVNPIYTPHRYHNRSDCPVDAYERILEALIYPGMTDRLDEIQIHEERTYSWVFGDAEPRNTTDSHGTPVRESRSPCIIADWLSTGDQIFLILGKPGAGKSTFMKFLLKEPRTKTSLQAWSSDLPPHILFHSFWGLSHTVAQKNWKGFLASLATQIIQKDPQVVPSIVNADILRKDFDSLSEHDLRGLIVTAMQVSMHRYCILVDGLDEAEYRQIHDIIVWIQQIVNQSENKCKVCIAARPLHYINPEYVRPKGLMIFHEWTAGDLKIYVEGRLRQNLAVKHDSHSEKQILRLAESICHKAEGVWIWVYHVMLRIENELSIEHDLDTLGQIVDELPTEVSDLYRRALDDVRKRGRDRHLSEQDRIFNMSRFFPLPLFQVYIATQDSVRSEYILQQKHKDEDWIASKCNGFRRKLYDITGCLLESVGDSDFGRKLSEGIVDLPLSFGRLKIQLVGTNDLASAMSQLRSFWEHQPWRIEKVGFIHRTVYEFLKESGLIPQKASSHHSKIQVESLLASCLEDVIPLGVGYFSYYLFALLTGIESAHADVIDTCDEFCRNLVESRLSSLNQMSPSTPRRDSSEGRWVWELLRTKRQGSKHLVHIPCQSLDLVAVLCYYHKSSIVQYLLGQRGQRWSRYYQSYLAFCAINSSFGRATGPDHDPKPLTEILSAIQERGVDLNTTIVSTSERWPRAFFRPESCISRLVGIIVVGIIDYRSDPPTEPIGLNAITTSLMRLTLRQDLSLSPFEISLFAVKESYASLCIELFFDVREIGAFQGVSKNHFWMESPGSDFQCATTLVVIKSAAGVIEILRELANKNDELLFLDDQNSKERFLERLVRLPIRTYLMLLDEDTKKYFWIPTPSQLEGRLIEAIFSRDNKQMSLIDSELRVLIDGPITVEGPPDVYGVDLAVPPRTPLEPIDPRQEMVDGNWKEVCALRGYYGYSTEISCATTLATASTATAGARAEDAALPARKTLKRRRDVSE